MKIDELIEKYKDSIIECERVMKAYQHTEETKFIHKGLKQGYQEILQDLEQLKEKEIK